MVEERCVYIPLDVCMVDIDVEMVSTVLEPSRLEEARKGPRRVQGQMAGPVISD
jgi:hypothetical protein